MYGQRMRGSIQIEYSTPNQRARDRLHRMGEFRVRRFLKVLAS